MRKNYTITRGDTKVIEETLNQDGLPMDLLTADITFTVEDLFSKTLDDGAVVTTPLYGELTVLPDVSVP